MLTRVVTGLILAAGIVCLLVFAPWWALGIVVALAAPIAALELLAMSRPGATSADKLIVGAACTLVATWPLLARALPSLTHGAALTAGFAVLALAHLARPEPIDQAHRRLSADVLALAYIGVSFPFILLLNDRPHGGFQVLTAMAVTFLGDTGGYFFGKTLGRHKLAPRVSPKKTIEGALGGVALAIGGAFLARAVFPGQAALSVVDCLVLGGVGATLGMVGDLVESLIKRACGVKDSGNLIPGHGGILDRVDGLLFVGPFVYYYLGAALSC